MEGLRFIQKILLFIGSISLLGSFIILIFSGLIVSILFGEQYNTTAALLMIIAFVPFLANLSSIFGIQTLLTLNYKKEYTQITLINCTVKILLSVILVQLLTSYGVAISELVTNFVSAVLFYAMLVSKNVNLFSIKERPKKENDQENIVVPEITE